MEIDERTRAALDRLTANERECLRRRLIPQTAKEMAIALGISPHAVEKRLKMARTKLGLSSSLAAARLLAGYERSVPLQSELTDEGEADQAERAAPGNRRRLYLISGVTLMTLILAALFAFTSQQEVPPAGMRKASLDDVTAFLTEAFESFDRDHSGFLDAAEAGRLEPRDGRRDPSLRSAPDGARDPAAETKWMGKLDTDGDGKVSQREYLTYMTPWMLASGVPSAWRPRR